jgi:hypothetical protein
VFYHVAPTDTVFSDWRVLNHTVWKVLHGDENALKTTARKIYIPIFSDSWYSSVNAYLQPSFRWISQIEPKMNTTMCLSDFSLQKNPWKTSGPLNFLSILKEVSKMEFWRLLLPFSQNFLHVSFYINDCSHNCKVCVKWRSRFNGVFSIYTLPFSVSSINVHLNSLQKSLKFIDHFPIFFSIPSPPTLSIYSHAIFEITVLMFE